MSFEDPYLLKTNPFRMTPATSPDDIVWAGFSEMKEKFSKRIKRTIKIPNSSLTLNWGEYGSGKTHAARYFNKTDVLKDLAGDLSIPYSMVIPLPKGKEPVSDIYTSVIDKLRIEDIREQFGSANVELDHAIDNITDNTQIQSVLKAIFNEEQKDVDLLRKYLYNNVTKAELTRLNEFGILRQLNSDSDYTKLLAGLFTCLTFEKKVFSSVIIWLDEFEDLAVLSSSNIDKANNFLREILDNTPNNLLIFLNLTQSALFGVEDLGEYVYESVRSRIKERINFDLPSDSDFKIYLKDLIKLHRVGVHDNSYFPFEEDAVNAVLEELDNASLRKFNEDFSLLLELAEMDKQCPITKDYFERNKSEIIGWKEE